MKHVIPCLNKEECPYKKRGELYDGKRENWICDKPPYPVLAPKFCLWRRLAEA